MCKTYSIEIYFDEQNVSYKEIVQAKDGEDSTGAGKAFCREWCHNLIYLESARRGLSKGEKVSQQTSWKNESVWS